MSMAGRDSNNTSANDESLVSRLIFTAKSVLVFSINVADRSHQVKSRLDWKHASVPSEADTFISNNQEKAGDVNVASSNSAIKEHRRLKWNLRSSSYRACFRQTSLTWNEVTASNVYRLQSRPSGKNLSKQKNVGNSVSSDPFSKLSKLLLKVHRKPVIQQSEAGARVCNGITSFDDDQQAVTDTFANTTHADVQNLTVENESRPKLRWKLRSAARREDVSLPELQRWNNEKLPDCATMPFNINFDQPLCRECFLSLYGNEQLENDWLDAELNYSDFPTSVCEQERNQINRNINQLEIAIEDYEDNFADTFKNLPALHTPNPALSETDVNDFEFGEDETYQAFIANLKLLSQSENAVDGDKDNNVTIQCEEELHEDGNASSLSFEMFNSDNTDILINESDVSFCSSSDTVVESVQIVNETVNCCEEEVVVQSACSAAAKQAKRTTRCRKAKPCTAANKATGSKRKYCKRSDRSIAEVATTLTTENNCYSQMLVKFQEQQQQQQQQNNEILNQVLFVPVVVQSSAPVVQQCTNSNASNAQQVNYLDDNLMDEIEGRFCRRKPRLIVKRRAEAVQPRNLLTF